MTSDCIRPLVPGDCDLAGIEYIAIDMKLFDSDLNAMSTGDEFKAAMNLYGATYRRVPAGSLPNDDRMLAFLSGAGDRWRKVRDVALRGWVLCSDGRLYHPRTAERVLFAWIKRLTKRVGGAKTNAARWGTSDRLGDLQRQLAEAYSCLHRLNPDAPVLKTKSAEAIAKMSQSESLSESLSDAHSETQSESHENDNGNGRGKSPNQEKDSKVVRFTPRGDVQ